MLCLQHLMLLALLAWRGVAFGGSWGQRRTDLVRLLSVVDGTEDKAAAPEEETRRITWTAAVKSSVRVTEAKRSARDYMALPASQYSILAADQIERISDTEFKAVLGKLNFFGTIIVPILYVDVNVVPEEHRAEILVSRAETTGSETADQISGTFKIKAMNLVSAGDDDKGRPTLTSETSLKIDVLVPESTKIPTRLIQSGGNFIIQSSLNVIVPTFIRVLREDFKRWSAGDDSRAAVEGATLG